MKYKLLILAAILAVLLAAFCCTLARQDEARLQGYDVLARPGDKVVLRAKLESMATPVFHKDIRGVTVFFELDGKVVGSAVTDGQGWADVAYHVSENAGRDLTVTCALAPGDKYLAEPANILVVIKKNTAPAIVTDIDHTIADVGSAGFLVKSNESVPALPGAPEALTRLSKKYTIIYVTARDDAFMNTTKEWLDLRKFPKGPVFFNDYGGKSMSATKYKTAEIARLKKRFPNITAGVGDKVGDAEAYLANGMRAFLIGDKMPEDMPEGARFARSWAEVEKLLQE